MSTCSIAASWATARCASSSTWTKRWSGPEEQIVYRTIEKLPMAEFPTPAYKRIDLRKYLLGSIQFSSGCPFTCEFCDIPSLYGRNPRLKSPQQVIAELDELADGGCVSVYFVDDNFIGNPKAAAELMPHLIEWQKRRDCQVRLSCEATLNMAVAHARSSSRCARPFSPTSSSASRRRSPPRSRR